MAITYPLAFPTYTRVSSFELTETNAVSFSRSPFSYVGQAFNWGGQMWTASITLPAMKMGSSEAKGWGAFLSSLNGNMGRFYMGDLDHCNISGTATTVTVTGTAGSGTLTASIGVGETLLAGDMIQIGDGEDATLHKVLFDVTGTDLGDTLEIWPALRKDRTNALLTLSNPQGVFRLMDNTVSRTRNNSGFVTISFGAMEAV